MNVTSTEEISSRSGGYSPAGLRSVSPEQVEQLSEDELRSLLFDCLNSKSDRLYGEKDTLGMPTVPVVRLYRRGGYGLRTRLRRIIAEFVHDVSTPPEDSNWSDNGIVQLLRLSDPILLEIDNRNAVCEDIRRIGQKGGELLYWSYQALVTLRYRQEADFWKRLYDGTDGRYLTLALGGLSILDVSRPISWIAELTWSKDLETRFLGTLPGLADRYSVGQVQACLSATLPNLSAEAQQAIKTFCSDEGWTLLTGPSSSGPRPLWYFRHYGVLSTFFLLTLLLAQLTALGAIGVNGIIPGWLNAGTVLIGVTFGFSTMITEVYGYQRSRRAIWRSLLIVSFACVGPAAFFGFGRRIMWVMFWSLVAVTCGELMNALAIKFQKDRHAQWYRTGPTLKRMFLAGIVGYLVDSALFGFLAMPLGVRWTWAGEAFIYKAILFLLLLGPMLGLVRFFQRREGIAVCDRASGTNPLQWKVQDEEYTTAPLDDEPPREKVFLSISNRPFHEV